MRHTLAAFVAWLLVLAVATADGASRRDSDNPFVVAGGLDDKDWSASFVLDGSFVHNAGELQVNITNWGLIGSKPGLDSTYSKAPSAMWPAGSGKDYLYAAGLWIGAVRDGIPLVTTGQFENELLSTDDPASII
jgi:hypothetical protein